MLNLIGKTTSGGWRIETAAPFPSDQTGGYFSSCFFVVKDGRKAFLKALDIEKFSFTQLSGLLAGFEYEKELLSFCNSKSLSRVVQVIESGEIERDPTAPPVLRMVPYLVFEMADGDIRHTVDISANVTDQWRFYVLHQTTLALLQLHAQSIAHQDLKPSNVLKFGAGRLKLGDLGRSSLRGKPAPHDNLASPGALNYAPFEQSYSYLPADWVERRLSSDVFHLGCLVIFSFANVCYPEFVMQKLAAPYKLGNWGGSYQEVMPHIQAAAAVAIGEISEDFPGRFKKDLTEIVMDLCHPDPSLRGRSCMKSKTSIGLLWLQRYASRFDILEKAARVNAPTNHA